MNAKRRIGILVFGALLLLLYCLLFLIFEIPCPIRYFTGNRCAGCGMTRAFLEALKFNFSDAFIYHPLWFSVPIFMAALAFFFLKRMKKCVYITLIVFCILMFTVYFIRIYMKLPFEPEDLSALCLFIL